MNLEIELAKKELTDITGFKGNRSDFSYNFMKYLQEKEITTGDGFKICVKIQKEIESQPIMDIEKRLNELCDFYSSKRNPKICVKCHGELLEHAKYCTHCGRIILNK